MLRYFGDISEWFSRMHPRVSPLKIFIEVSFGNSGSSILENDLIHASFVLQNVILGFQGDPFFELEVLYDFFGIESNIPLLINSIPGVFNHFRNSSV